MQEQRSLELAYSLDRLFNRQNLKNQSYSFLKIALYQPTHQNTSNHIGHYDYQCEGLQILDKIIKFKLQTLKLKAFMQLKKKAPNTSKLIERKALSVNCKTKFTTVSYIQQRKKITMNKSSSLLKHKNIQFSPFTVNSLNPEEQLSYSREQNISVLLENLRSVNNSNVKHMKTDSSLQKSKLTGIDEGKSIGYYHPTENQKKINELISVIKESRSKIHKKAGYHAMNYAFFNTSLQNKQRNIAGGTDRKYLKTEECFHGYCCIHGRH